MEESHPQQHDQQIRLSQAIRFKTQLVDPTHFKISRQRTVSPLQIKDRTQSSQTKNFKEKHLMYKKDLLQQKFQNLQLNQKQDKKPLKLRLQRVNKENMIVLKELGNISNGLQIKFQTQNCLIQRSLDKMERLASRSIPQRILQRVESSKKIGQKSKLQLGPTENQKNLQAQLEKITDEKNKFQEEIKGMKSVNQFLSNQNYKLSMENSMLKQRINESEQNDYDNALKTVKDSESEDNQSVEESDKEEKGDDSFKTEEEFNINTQQESIVFDIKLNVPKKDASQREFLKQISTQKSQNSPNQYQSQVKSLAQSMRRGISAKQSEKLMMQVCEKCKKNTSAAQEILRLVSNVNKLEQQLEDQRMMNESLYNKIALLKLRLYETTQDKKSQDTDFKMDSAVSINMEIKKIKEQNRYEPEQESEQSSDGIKQSERTPEPPSFRYPHKVTKSNILSNQIIYFAQPLYRQKDKPQKSTQNIEKQYQSMKKKSFNVIEILLAQIEQRIKENDNTDQKRKTLCLKKLQIPLLQVQKRRKSITEKLSNSVLAKIPNLGNSLSFYSNQKVNQLQIIRQTISLKFQAFKYTFELFQNQMILWPNNKLNIKQLKSILSEYPFFLDESAIETVLGYCSIVQDKEIKVDKFCNKLKEFIQEYEEMTEEEELILQKKIYKRWKYTKDEILEVMKKHETGAGEITKAKFVSVLDEFKFEEKEIHHLLSQSVAISSDINRIKYRQYLANFLTKK